MQHLAETGLWARGRDEVLAMLQDVRDATEEQARAAFPGLRDVEWYTVARRVASELAYLAEWGGDYQFSVGPASQVGYTIVEGQRAIAVDASVRHAIRRGNITYPFLEDRRFEEWLLPASMPRDNDPPTIQLGNVSLYGVRYHAWRWWDRGIRLAYRHDALRGRQDALGEEARQEYEAFSAELASRIHEIEAGDYPKNPGDHCHFCPVRADCLGLEP